MTSISTVFAYIGNIFPSFALIHVLRGRSQKKQCNVVSRWYKQKNNEINTHS